MRKYSLHFLVLIISLSLFSIPTVHVVFEQNNNSYHLSHHSKYTHHYPHVIKDNLFSYSSTQLQKYFDNHHYSEKDVLAQNALYMSDAFVQLIKTYPDYEKALTKLYKKLKHMNVFQRCIHWISHSNKHLKRIEHLYQELKQYHQCTTTKALSFATFYHINLLHLFPYNEASVAQQVYKNYISILERASNIADHNSIVRDSIGKASGIGLEANKQGYTKYAAKIADFCWLMLDCAIAFDEGIYLGAAHTFDAITHPVETIKNSLIGIGMIACGLSKLISIPIECVLLYATDEHDFYLRTDVICDQLIAIANNIMRYVETTPPRDIVKQGSALLTETVLLTKISSFAYDVSKKLLPPAFNYIEYVTKTEPVVCFADGAIVKVDVPKNINLKAIRDNISKIESIQSFPQGISKKLPSISLNIQEVTQAIQAIEPNRIHHNFNSNNRKTCLV